MVKIAWILVTAVFHNDRVVMGELSYLDSYEQCERYAQGQIDEWRKHDVPLEHINTSCIQVVVPADEDKK